MGKVELRNKKVLVTGGNGYLGRHLVRNLKNEGAIVYIMDISGEKNEQTFIVDLTDRNEVEIAILEIQPDFVFHLAASLNRERSFDRYDETKNINLNGTFNLLNALKDTNYQNFIFTSTSEVYGSNIPPFSETQIPDPASPYSLTKIYAENLVRTFSKINNKNFTILRLFNFYGKNMSPNFFIPQMVNTLKENLPFKMTEGAQKRDFLFIDDVVRALILSTKKMGRNDTYNVCSGQGVSLKDLVLEVKSNTNSKSDIIFGAIPYRENEVWNMVGDNSKIMKILGFNPIFNLKNGIKEII